MQATWLSTWSACACYLVPHKEVTLTAVVFESGFCWCSFVPHPVTLGSNMDSHCQLCTHLHFFGINVWGQICIEIWNYYYFFVFSCAPFFFLVWCEVAWLTWNKLLSHICLDCCFTFVCCTLLRECWLTQCWTPGGFQGGHSLHCNLTKEWLEKRSLTTHSLQVCSCGTAFFISDLWNQYRLKPSRFVSFAQQEQWMRCVRSDNSKSMYCQLILQDKAYCTSREIWF